MKLYKMIFAVLVVILMTLTACDAQTEPTAPVSEPTASAPETKAPAEEVTAETLPEAYDAPDFTAILLDGSEFTLSEYLDETVVINFWATWCPPCVSEMPDLQRLAENYADQGVYVLAVNCGETEQKVRDFIEERELALNVCLDTNMNIQFKYPTNGIPYTVFVGPDGKVVYTQTGIHSDDNYGHLAGILDKILLR